jgi:hypothetical protein
MMDLMYGADERPLKEKLHDSRTVVRCDETKKILKKIGRK